MSWVKLDDRWIQHPKIVVLSDRAFRLWSAGMAYCARNLTDGVISMRQVPHLLPSDNLSALIEELTEPQVDGKAPLWELTEGGGSIRVHDWHEYNPPAAEVLASRAAAKERMGAIRALRRLGLGDDITVEQWQTLPDKLQAHFSKGRNGTMSRLKAGPVHLNVQGNDLQNVSGTPAERSGSVPVAFNTPVPVPVPQEEKLKTPLPPAGGGGAPTGIANLLDGVGGGSGKPPTARWAAKAKRPPGVTPRALEAAVTRCLRELRQEPVVPERCATAAGIVLSLWRALSHPPLDTFAEDLVLVARAAQMSAERIFARDIRAEGWSEGADRTFHVDTLCVHRKWDDRLRVAQAWGLASKRIGEDGVARAWRTRWLDPRQGPSAWERLDEPEPLLGMYLRCAHELFEAELAGEALQGAMERLEGFKARQGLSGDLTAVVRLALDETGRW